jgi:phosphoenolpyruvate synthase/pyruvate phosphate dikinase
LNLKTICHLDEIGPGDSPAVGTKAAALGALRRAGFSVPAGFVLTTSAYAQVISSLRGRIEARVTAEAIIDPAEVETAANEVREWIETEAWPLDLHSELANALIPLMADGQTPSFAIRTSLPSEELATAFGTGVQRAALGLAGLENIERGTARCWGALWSSRSMYYRHRKRIPQTQVALAVLIQPMIHAEAAGVMFTRNPMSDDDDGIQINSIWGLGSPLTQARVSPDRFLFGTRELMIRQRQIEDKTVRLVVASDGGLEQQAVEKSQIQAPSLTDSQITALAQLGERIEQLFGEPQSIEWARVGDHFHILQARPIAARTS